MDVSGKMVEKPPHFTQTSGVLSFFLWNIYGLLGVSPPFLGFTPQMEPTKSPGYWEAAGLGATAAGLGLAAKVLLGRWDDGMVVLVCRCSCNGVFRKWWMNCYCYGTFLKDRKMIYCIYISGFFKSNFSQWKGEVEATPHPNNLGFFFFLQQTKLLAGNGKHVHFQ